MEPVPAYLKQIINSIADPIFVKDKEHRWVFLNAAFCELMGYSEQDLLGKSDVDFFPAKEAKVFWEKDEQVIRTGEENVNEEFFTDGEGITRTIVTKKTLYADPKGDLFIVGIIRDITELRSATQELEAAYKKLVTMQERMLRSEKMASLGQLVAGIAHEINNPAAYILSNLQTLQEYCSKLEAIASRIPAGVMEDAEKFQLVLKDLPALTSETIQGAERIRKIVQDLGIFAHPSEGVFAFGDLHACLERAIGIMMNQLQERITLLRDYGDLPPVCFKEQQMFQVFLNLLVNAAQAIDGPGTITIRTRSQEGVVQIDISDTGGGILEPHLSRVFDPFFTTKPVGQGTGLGLSIVHGIIEQHRGSINVTSKAGAGTTFTLRLLNNGPSSDERILA